MKVSFSKVKTYKQCPYRYDLHYNRGLKPIRESKVDDPLIIGTAMHKGIEEGVSVALEWYKDQYNVMDDSHLVELMKLEYLIPKVKEVLPVGEYETEISVKEPFDFIGYTDMLVPLEDGSYDLYDFKYSNNIDSYLSSGQLEVYKTILERTGKRINRMYYVFIPKIQIRLKKTESQELFRLRLKGQLEDAKIQIVETNDPNAYLNFLTDVKAMVTATEYPKCQSRLCDWCDYQTFCESNEPDVSDMELPKNEKRNIENVTSKKIWIYGQPFSGKTYLANAFPNPLMLNTDGNIKFVDAPYIAIKDIVTVEGRQTKRKMGWQVFKECVEELEKKQNDFQTIVLDVVGDIFEMCRTYMFDKMKIEHESDSAFGKGWSMVKKEFLDVMQRFMNLDYDNIVLISHEDSSKDITKKSGDKVSTIRPSNSNQYADRLAGMVDLVARLVNDDGKRTLNFKSNEYVFGGGRLDFKCTSIPCSYDALCDLYAGKVETRRI